MGFVTPGQLVTAGPIKRVEQRKAKIATRENVDAASTMLVGQVSHPIGLSEDPAELPEGVGGENWDHTVRALRLPEIST